MRSPVKVPAARPFVCVLSPRRDPLLPSPQIHVMAGAPAREVPYASDGIYGPRVQSPVLDRA